MNSFSETSDNIAISHIAKIDTLDYIYRYVADSRGSIFNHFYVIEHKSYQIRRNNATAITQFKVTQGNRFGSNRMPMCELPTVVNTNLHRFQVIADY